jgi:hypothetical protein
VNILFDDTSVLPGAENSIGSILYADEIGPLRLLGEALDALIGDLGEDPDFRYLSDPRWKTIIDRAAAVRDAMQQHEDDAME